MPLATPADRFAALYRSALPEVFAYLASRVGDRTVAEDLTQETFLAAARTIKDGRTDDVSVAWLVAVARNKLMDHYRRAQRDQRATARVAVPTTAGAAAEGGRAQALDAMAALTADHRTVLVLRYLDDLPVSEVAALMGRSVHATESLLARARDAFKRSYGEAFDE